MLSEIAMNPNALARAVQSINATAGMEFELIIPDLGDIEGDGEVDYDRNDEEVRDFYHIRNFFEQGDMNARRDIDSMVERLEDQYREDFVYDQMSEQFHENATELVGEHIEYSMTWGEVVSEYLAQIEEVFDENDMEWDDDWDSDKIVSLIDDNNLEQEVYAKCAEHAIEEYDRNFESAREDWEQENYEEIYSLESNQREWLSNQGLGWMSTVQQNYGYENDVYWPFMGTGDAEARMEDLADTFGGAVGKPVNVSTTYHSGIRNAGEYTIEPDSSLSGDSYDDGGLEFISPPMPLTDMLADLEAVAEWCRQESAYTNSSTGLHMNISIPNYSKSELDFTKLALLLGDQHVLQLFGRAFNGYARSMYDEVENNIRGASEKEMAGLFAQIKQGLNKEAGKAIHTGYTQKYSSINVKDSHVEFRSPGGDWLDMDLADVKNTLLRFVVALDAACDPEKYKEEYMKKLYKMMAKYAEKDQVDITQAFARYTSGDIDKADLKQLISQRIQNTRDRKGKQANAVDPNAQLADSIGAVFSYLQKYEVGSGNAIPTNIENEVYKIAKEVGANSQVQTRLEELLNRIESTDEGARGSMDAVQVLSRWLKTQYEKL